MASFVPLHGSWCWFKMKAIARKVPGRARASDELQSYRRGLTRRSLTTGKQSSTTRRTPRSQVVRCEHLIEPGAAFRSSWGSACRAIAQVLR